MAATTSYPDVVILWIVTYMSGSSITVSTSTPPSATGVTFQSTARETLVSCSAPGADETTETEWWGTTAAATSSETVTVTLSAAPTHAIGYAMAFKGVNTASPFDSHTGLPATGVSTACGTAADPATTTGLQTTNADDLIVNFFGGNSAAETSGTIAGSAAAAIADASHVDYSIAAESLVVTAAESTSQACSFTAATSTFYGDVCDALVAVPTPTYSIVPDSTTSVVGTPSQSTPSNNGWEINLSGASILSAPWTFGLTTTASAASGTAYVWITVWNCSTKSGGCTFLFKNYDNSTNVLSTTTLTTNTYNTASAEGPFYNVDFLRVEYWIVYASVGTSTTSTITETSGVSSDADVVVPTLGASWPITVATPAGGTAFSYTMSGCSVAPTSGTSGSTPTDFTASASCAVTITMPAAGSNARYVFASSASTYSTVATCSTLCTNPSPSDYYQLGNTFEITANAQTDFDTGMTALTIKGTVAGVASTTVCTITITAATSDACSANPGWSDYDTAVTGFTNPISGAPAHSRWEASTTCTYTFTTYGTGDCEYYKQWEFELYYTIEDAGSGYSAPVLTSTQYGSSYTPSLGTTSGTVYWLDNGASWSTTNPLSGSTGTEQWDSDTIASFSGTVSSTSPITAGTTAKDLLYYNQYLQTLSYSVVDGGSPSSPTATGTSLGSAYAPSLATTATGYWFDALGSIAFSTPTGTNEQWAPSPPSVSATSSNTQVASLYNQYKHTLSYAVVDGGSPSAPTASDTSLGSSYTPTLTTTATAYWFDASGSIAVSTPTNGVSERWSPSPSSVSATSSNTQVFSLYNQYSQTLSYNVNDGGSGYSAPSTIGGLQLGSSYSPTITTTATGYWFDATGTLTFTHPLTCGGGCPTGERWSENSVSASLVSANTQAVQYYNQYEPSVSYLAEDAGNPSGNALVLSYSYFGAAGTTYTLTGSATPEWIDASSLYSVGDHYVSSTERYSQNQNGTLSNATAVVFDIYHQFAGNSSYSGTVSLGGAPSLSGTLFGTGSSATLLTTSATPVWLDAGTSYVVTKPSANFPSSTERYETSFANGTIASSITVNPTFYHQFDVSATYFTSDDSAIPEADGSITMTAVQFGESVTPTLTTTATSYWLDAGSSWSVTPNVLPASPSGERWDANNVGVSGSASSSTTIAPDYLHQYLLTVTGGNGVTYGTASQTSDDWYDAGSNTTVTSNWVWNTVSGQSESAITDYQVDGVGQNPTRADTGTLTTVSVTFNAAHTVAFLSTTQYYLTVNGGNGVSYGTPSPVGDNWYDSGTSTTVSSSGVYGRASGTGQRVSSWNVDGASDTSVATTGTVTTSTVTMSTYHAVNFNSVTQYFLTDNDPSGSESSITSPAISGDTGWYDSGTSVTIALNNVYGLVPDSSRNNLVSYTQAGNTTPVTRSGTGTATESTIDMSAPTTVSATYIVQYYLALSTDCYSAAVSAMSPTDDGWYDSGTSLDVQCSGISGRSDGTGKRAEDYYWDSSSQTVEATTGTYTTTSVTMSVAHTLNVDAVVQFQVALVASPTEGGSASFEHRSSHQRGRGLVRRRFRDLHIGRPQCLLVVRILERKLGFDNARVGQLGVDDRHDKRRGDGHGRVRGHHSPLRRRSHAGVPNDRPRAIDHVDGEPVRRHRLLLRLSVVQLLRLQQPDLRRHSCDLRSVARIFYNILLPGHRLLVCLGMFCRRHHRR